MNHTEISISPENQRQAAANHKAVGHELNGFASIFDDAVEWGQGLGPIFKEWFAALSEIIEDRRAFYTEAAEDHHRFVTSLSNAADMWAANEAQAAKDIGSIS